MNTPGPATSPVPREYYDEDDGTNRCLVCGDPRYTLLHRPTHFGFPIEFHQCGCGLIKQIPMPNEHFFDWFFNSELFFSSKQTESKEIWGFYDYFLDEPSRLKTSRRRYRLLSRKLAWQAPRRIMKIGPSTGTFLHVAQEAGHEVLGCDVSNEFAAYAREHYGVKIDHGRFERMGYADGQFDDLLLLNVIENVPNLEEFLEAIARTVRRGGNFILNHVEMRWNELAALQRDKYFIFRPPVCYVFERAVLDRLLNKYGFAVRFRVRDIRYMHIEKMATLLRWRGVLSAARRLGIARREFPVWAYPSWITVAQKVD